MGASVVRAVGSHYADSTTATDTGGWRGILTRRSSIRPGIHQQTQPAILWCRGQPMTHAWSEHRINWGCRHPARLYRLACEQAQILAELTGENLDSDRDGADEIRRDRQSWQSQGWRRSQWQLRVPHALESRGPLQVQPIRERQFT